MKLMVINGVNLNMIGIREPEIYGDITYDYLCDYVKNSTSCDLEFVQSNHEGDIVDAVHRAHFENFDGIIINPGAFTHYSYAIYDALKSVKVPTIEVHISNIHNRETFRQTSVTAKACVGQMSGFGIAGYVYAIHAIKDIVKSKI